MNIESLDMDRLRLPRTPRRPVDQRDTGWIDHLMREIEGTGAISSVAAPDRLTAMNDYEAVGGRRLRAA